MNEKLSRLFLSQAPPVPSVGARLTADQAQALAIHQALQAYGFTSPNPAVGCVILDRDDRFLGMGHHRRAGEPHAEAEALASLLPGRKLERGADGWDLSALPTEKLRGAKAFVTLEPCAHEGRTPSCARTLARLPLAEVTAVLKDPFEKVQGRGFQILREAGFRVRCLEDEGESDGVAAARAACEFFLVNVVEKRPFVSLKVATSLDGIMALKNGDSKWITGEESRDFARFLRGAHEACLVGKNTVLQDDPRLDARETPFASAHRKLVVLDAQAEILHRPELRVFGAHRPEDIFVVVGAKAKVPAGSQAQVIPVRNEEHALPELLAALWAREIRSVWIEGGAQTLSSALKEGPADRLWLFQGPVLLGAQNGRSWTEAWGVSKMEERRSIGEVRHLSLGQDQLTTGRLSKSMT